MRAAMLSMAAGVAERLGNGFMYAGFGLILLMPGIWAYQCIHWLKHGTWMPLPLSEVSSALGIETEQALGNIAWNGVAQVVSFLLSLPVSMMAFFAGAAVVWCGLQLLETSEALEHSRRRNGNRHR